MPAIEAQADIYEERDALIRTTIQTKGTDLALSKIEDLKQRNDEIYNQVENSEPPPALVEWKQNWLKELELYSQGYGSIIECLTTENDQMLHTADDLLFEARDVKARNNELLFAILDEHEVDINELCSNESDGTIHPFYVF
jgi:hypothetical protein